MKNHILICLFLIAVSSHAKIPSSPLFHLQFWAMNLGGEILTDNPIGSGKIFQFSTKAGVDMNLAKAWDISTGSKKVTVGIIDDGFELNHENYRDNLGLGYNAINPGSPPDSCLIDIDRMGQSTYGCAYSHGNMALGIIGAKPSREFGIAGVNWNVTLMPLKVSDQQGVGADRSKEPARIAEAIKFAVENGAKIINWSGFVTNITENGEKKLRAAIDFAKQKNVIFIIAAGNGLINMDKNKNKLPFPMSSDFENVIYIANVYGDGELVNYEKNPLGNRIGGSNYGLRAFMAAPAEFGVTTMNIENNKSTYFLAGGTSSAAPLVAGVAALILSVNPKLGYKDIKKILCSTARKLDSLEGKTYCGGIPDAYAALKMAKAIL